MGDVAKIPLPCNGESFSVVQANSLVNGYPCDMILVCKCNYELNERVVDHCVELLYPT